ncbi:hypothetical protein L5515_002733 [Caenorhabditis briggsae]|uniref:Uncharacterized protein n=1 Tax=Caenorhabditis briggsae TaxID=6238 RepID=A0AAE9E686_CAEBR|nr:hypothetical protein L5515_002733 [Caenorhabditis briggsae]
MGPPPIAHLARRPSSSPRALAPEVFFAEVRFEFYKANSEQQATSKSPKFDFRWMILMFPLILAIAYFIKFVVCDVIYTEHQDSTNAFNSTMEILNSENASVILN